VSGQTDIARYIYIGVTLLGYPEKDVWRMTPYKLMRLFEIHKEFNPDRFGSPEFDPVDVALGGI
jgi:hypothetical protein